MKIYNQAKTEVLQGFDPLEGRLQEDVLITCYPEVKEVKQQSHFVVIREYPNGGKDVEEVIDVEGVAYQPARETKEDIYVFIPYTNSEKAERRAKMRIRDLKDMLYASDYKAIKYAEGILSAEEYAPVKAERAAIRAEINALEESLQ